MADNKRVLMVCLGNTCRSPMAEAIFRDELIKMKVNNWEVDSAGLVNWHLGEPPNIRTMIILEEKGIDYSHETRIINVNDFRKFHWILAMDLSNLVELHQMKPDDSDVKIELLGSYDPQGEINIRDPYCDTDSTGFVQVYEQYKRSIERFLEIHQKNSVN